MSPNNFVQSNNDFATVIFGSISVVVVAGICLTVTVITIACVITSRRRSKKRKLGSDTTVQYNRGQNVSLRAYKQTVHGMGVTNKVVQQRYSAPLLPTANRVSSQREPVAAQTETSQIPVNREGAGQRTSNHIAPSPHSAPIPVPTLGFNMKSSMNKDGAPSSPTSINQGGRHIAPSSPTQDRRRIPPSPTPVNKDGRRRAPISEHSGSSPRKQNISFQNAENTEMKKERKTAGRVAPPPPTTKRTPNPRTLHVGPETSTKTRTNQGRGTRGPSSNVASGRDIDVQHQRQQDMELVHNQAYVQTGKSLMNQGGKKNNKSREQYSPPTIKQDTELVYNKAYMQTGKFLGNQGRKIHGHDGRNTASRVQYSPPILEQGMELVPNQAYMTPGKRPVLPGTVGANTAPTTENNVGIFDLEEDGYGYVIPQ
jgi:hypothetical protein